MENSPQNNRPTPPPFPSEYNQRRKSNKPMIWAIAGVATVVIGIALAIIIAKSPDSDVEFNGDSEESLFTKEEWADIDQHTQQYGLVDETDDWEKKYIRDEFGDEITSQPYIQRMIRGNKYYGQTSATEEDNMIITLDPRYGIELGIGAGVFNGNDQIIIRHQSGEREIIPYEELDDGNIRITDPSTTQRFVSILESGNIDMAIAGDSETRRWNFRISDEFQNIRIALRFMRDVPNIENIYGPIN